MKHLYFNFYRNAFLLALFFSISISKVSAQCGSGTPSYTADLSASPTATYLSPDTGRNDTCCGASNCVKFTIILHPNAVGINFAFYSGAQPPGSLFYQIGCAGTQSVGTPICLSGAGPHILTFCKPGGNSNEFLISSVEKPKVPDSIFVRSGCQQTLEATGFAAPTISWTAVNTTNTAVYNSYLNCTVGCPSIVVTPTGSPLPAFIDYEVSGFAAAPCISAFYRDTVRVYFFNDLLATLTPTTICFGSITAVLIPTVTGGKPPYSYLWSTAATSSNITVGAGVYTLTLFDQTGCPPDTAAVRVSQFTLPISANIGPDRTLCKSNPTVALSGTIGIASGGAWSGGTGTFAPSTTTLTTSYVPTTAEIAAGSVQLYLTSTGNSGCPPGKDTVNIGFQNIPLVTTATDKTLCANNAVTSFTASITGFTSTPVWSGSGSGSFSSFTATTISYTPSVADIAAGTVSLVVTTANNGVCAAATSTVKLVITPQPTVNAGTDQLICSTQTAALLGTVTGPTNTINWTTTGNGTFTPNGSVLTASYIPGSTDITTGTVNLVLTSNSGNCLPVRDTVKITVRKLAVVNAGLNQLICSNQGSIVLSGSVTGGTTTGIWAGTGGNFTPTNTSLATSYSMTVGDITTGSVIFTLSSTNNGPCPVVNDTVKIAIRTLAVVNAGFNQSLCSSQNTIALSGSVISNSNTGSWQASGTGNFSPNNTNLAANYSLTAADITNGFVTFTLSSTNTSPCPVVIDTVRMKVTKLATVNAGLNQFVCSASNSIVLTGTVSGGTTSGSWGSTGGGTFTPSGNTPTTAYLFTSTDVSAGSVIFTLTSTGNGPCAAVSDTVKMAIKALAVVNAGGNQILCSNQPTISINGVVISSTGTGSWVASGTGSFIPGSSSLSTAYSVTPQDITSGSVTFTLNSTNNGVCPVVTDTVRMRIIKQATVNAGANQSICSGTGSINLTGTAISGNPPYAWTSNGSGGFTPNNTALITNYTISPSDIVNGSVIFTLTSPTNGPCQAVSDSVKVLIKTIASVNAGGNQFICSSQNSITLNGIVTGASGTGSWTPSGTGTLTSNSNLNTFYLLSAADITNGSVTFTLVSTFNGLCPAVKDTVKIKVMKLAQVEAGNNQSICSTQNSVVISGTVNGGGGGGSWISNGSGTFSAGPGNLNNAYIINTSDITSGSVLLTLLSSNSAPCPEVTDTLRVMIQTPAQVNAGLPQTICSNTNYINLAGLISGGSGQGIWTSDGNGKFNPGNVNLTTSYSVSPDDIALGGINFSLTSTGNGGCAAVVSVVNVTIKKLATVNAGVDKVICSSQNIVNLSGFVGGSTSTGSWSANGTGSFAPSGTNLNGNYAVTTADINKGSIFIFLHSTNSSVCPEVTDTLKLSIIRNPIILLRSDTTICEKLLPLKVNAGLSGGSGMLLWSSSGTGSFSPNAQSATISYYGTTADVKTGTVLLTASSVSNGPCGVVSSSMKLRLLPSPKADFSVPEYTVYLPTGAIVFTNKSTGATKYSWNLGEGVTSTLINPTHSYNSVGFYTVTLKATNDYDCSDAVEKVLAILSEVRFPNAFTPNPNGSNGGVYNERDFSNDVFFPFTDGVTDYDLMIFNRWGELIFESKDLKTGWDGYYNGKLCQQDAYVWKANITFFDGRTFNKTGTVTLLR